MIEQDPELDLSYLNPRRLTEAEVEKANEIFVKYADTGMELCFVHETAFPDYVWLSGVADKEKAERIEEEFEKAGIPYRRRWE